jgi:plasmid stability protein
MAKVLVEDLDPIILQKLETLAKQHGRSLQEELKHILQQASEKATHYHSGGDIQKAREAAFRIRQQLGGGIHTDSTKLIREDRER